MLKKIAELSGGQAFNASSLVELKNVYASLQGRCAHRESPTDIRLPRRS
jgi:hypothetical protein